MRRKVTAAIVSCGCGSLALAQSDFSEFDGPQVQEYPTLDLSYWYTREGSKDDIPAQLLKYRGAWPCMWGERILRHQGSPQWDSSYKICGGHMLQDPCVVYSFGSNDDFDFEDSLHAVAPHCEILIFDPSGSRHENRQVRQLALSNISGHEALKLKEDDAELTKVDSLTLADVMAANGHRHVDVLKIDIEGSEHRVIDQLHAAGWPSVGQLLMEVHIGPDLQNHTIADLDLLVSRLEHAGFRLFSAEPNSVWGKECCVIFSFIQAFWRPNVKDYPSLRGEIAASYSSETVALSFIPDGQSPIRVDAGQPAKLSAGASGFLFWEIMNVGSRTWSPGCWSPHGSIYLQWTAPKTHETQQPVAPGERAVRSQKHKFEICHGVLLF